MVATTRRLDVELVTRGLARSRTRAQVLVSQGRVRVAGAAATRPAQPVSPEHLLEVDDPDADYVSRAAHKLIGALDAVEDLVPGALRLDGARCLDVGASTGGFTQVLLERGAAHVLAVDVGHGQMASEVRVDPRVELREGVNARDLDLGEVGSPVDLLVADLSFISLRLVLPPLMQLVRPDGDLLVMVKPQFEVGRERLGADGVVHSSEQRAEAVFGVAETARVVGARVRAVLPSPLAGESGNREYFLWLQPSAAPVAAGGDAPVQDVLEPAVVAAVRSGAPTLVEGAP
ncbi:TlyA family RNA methyltransferase [Actinotalea sp. BY-33]|uniref:TlyA family RNA methyltransferase n=1 Tax=Actinotalea soli TaxID=2819234 RepID=A0A939LN34_9CELL|nr:TlyA family RNA methyltransferase [Actinotalea soli]MBO1750183.1 TlyA family RNA methyltransferase [Actinotalea soli]